MPGALLICIIIFALCIFAIVGHKVYIALQWAKIAEEKGYPKGRFFWKAFFLGREMQMLIHSMPDQNRKGRKKTGKRTQKTKE